MRKLHLDVSLLRVQSFTTAGVQPADLASDRCSGPYCALAGSVVQDGSCADAACGTVEAHEASQDCSGNCRSRGNCETGFCAHSRPLDGCDLAFESQGACSGQTCGRGCTV